MRLTILSAGCAFISSLRRRATEMSAHMNLDAIISGGLCRRLRKFRLAEHPLERSAQRHIRIAHRHRQPKINQARHAELRRGNSAWRDAGEMFQIRLNVER